MGSDDKRHVGPGPRRWWASLLAVATTYAVANVFFGLPAEGPLPDLRAQANQLPASPAGTATAGPGVDVYGAADMFDSSATAQAVAVLTEPDEGDAYGYTVRWLGPTVTYRVEVSYDERYMGVVRHALALAAVYTGVGLVEVAVGEPADLRVVAGDGNGAYVHAVVVDGAITSATVELGCCRDRAAYEDILQAFGVFGDHADSRSVFSNDTARTTPSAFDAWVLSTLYGLPPGSDPGQLHFALEQSRQRFATLAPLAQLPGDPSKTAP